MKKYFDLLRTKHYIKNILIFIPVICAGMVTFHNFIITFIAFITFSLMASGVYIINDLTDLENDKLHPNKKNRPIVKGDINKKTAYIFIIILFTISIILNSLINKSIFNLSLLYLIIYIILNILYSLILKKIAILDIIILASGFVLRIYYGASIFNILVSNWLFLTILSASLFLGLNKRKFDLNKEGFRIKDYTSSYLNNFAYLMLGLTLVFYSLWAMEQTNHIIYTVILLIMIFMRYNLIIEEKQEGDPVTILYQDKPLIFLCIIYALIILGIFLLI